MNGNDHAAAPREGASLFTILLSGGRRAIERLQPKNFFRRCGVLRAIAHRLALTAALAGAGHAQAQDVRDDGWVRILPRSGYGFGFYMEAARPAASTGAMPGKYDLLYTDRAQSARSATPLNAVNRSPAVPSMDAKAGTAPGGFERAAMATLAPGLNGAVPLMVFAGSISNRCAGNYAVCEPNRFIHESVLNVHAP